MKAIGSAVLSGHRPGDVISPGMHPNTLYRLRPIVACGNRRHLLHDRDGLLQTLEAVEKHVLMLNRKPYPWDIPAIEAYFAV